MTAGSLCNRSRRSTSSSRNCRSRRRSVASRGDNSFTIRTLTCAFVSEKTSLPFCRRGSPFFLQKDPLLADRENGDPFVFDLPPTCFVTQKSRAVARAIVGVDERVEMHWDHVRRAENR